MNKLEELLKETEFNTAEWEIFRKVDKHNKLEDLEYVMGLMGLTEEQEELIKQNADIIIERLDKLENDWIEDVKNAINYVIEQ